MGRGGVIARQPQADCADLDLASVYSLATMAETNYASCRRASRAQLAV